MIDIRDVRAWHLALSLAKQVIAALPESSSRKAPGVRAQAIRAANSVHANIAEGCGRATRLDLLRFLEIALGSLNELISHLEIAYSAGMITSQDHARLTSQTTLLRKMILSFRRVVQQQAAESMSR